MTDEIIAASDEVNARDDIRVLIITGEGPKAFSAGLDLKERAAEEVSMDAKEGPRAFAEKRKPVWKGR